MKVEEYIKKNLARNSKFSFPVNNNKQTGKEEEKLTNNFPKKPS